MILQSDAIANSQNKQRNLFLGIVLDLLGMLSYLIPFLGEFEDTLWAPLSGILLSILYKGSIGKVGGVIDFFEELLPFTDFIPTYTLTWIYTYVIKNQDGDFKKGF